MFDISTGLDFFFFLTNDTFAFIKFLEGHTRAMYNTALQ